MTNTTNNNTCQLNVYFDIDGVLARYERYAYHSEKPVAMQRGSHYFSKTIPDTRMVDLLEQCLKQPNMNVYVLSTLSNIGSLYVEQLTDKKEWLSRHIPDFDLKCFIPVITSKRQIAEFIKHKNLNMTDILIDDYNHNLNEWADHNGFAIKYLNGINSADSYKGPIIDNHMSIDDMITMITSVFNIISNYQKNTI